VIDGDLAELTKDDYHEGRRYEGFDFNDCDVSGHSFEDCEFVQCRFDGASLEKAVFNGCRFLRASLAVTNLRHATFNGTSFDGSKLMGVDFSDCNRFGFRPEFRDCLMDGLAFGGNDLTKTPFAGCRIKNSDFTDCDLRDAVFPDCRFEESRFLRCDLREADFRTAAGYRIDPFENNVKGAMFDLPEAESFLAFLEIEIG
jgi:uncharacterized protein YjbI with pentapeptide repeats